MFENGFPRKWSTIKKLALLFRAVVNAIAPVIKTVTGALIHITDALARPAQSLKVIFFPVQDLHGYANPWPAGGGLNKFDKDNYQTIVGGYLDVTTGVYRNGGSELGERLVYIPCKPSTTYTASNAIKDTIRVASFTAVPQSAGTSPTAANSPSGQQVAGTGISVTTGASDAYLIVQIIANADVSDGTTFAQAIDKLMIEEGSTVHTWQPYSNICPISGHTHANVVRAGANLMPIGTPPSYQLGVTVSDVTGGYKLTTTASSTFLFARFDLYDAKLFRGKSLTLSGTSIVDHTQNAQMRVRHLNLSGTVVSDGIINGSGSATINIPQDADGSISIYLYATGSVSSEIGWETVWTDIMLNIGSTAESYSPYVGTTYPIPFGQTVYGGTLDVTTGKLTVTDGYIASYNGETLPSTWISDRDVYAAGTTPTTGAEVVYKLKTPIEVDLTPTEITLLAGTNNLLSDANGNLELTYLADGNTSEIEALNILLGGQYSNNHGEDEPTDREALNILLGGNER